MHGLAHTCTQKHAGAMKGGLLFFFDPFYSQSIIKDCPPNCDQNESSTTLLTHDCKWWMEIIVPLSFVFRVQLAFRLPSCQISALPRISKTFLLECLGRESKGKQSGHVEVKGKRGCFALLLHVHICRGRHNSISIYTI